MPLAVLVHQGSDVRYFPAQSGVNNARYISVHVGYSELLMTVETAYLEHLIHGFFCIACVCCAATLPVPALGRPLASGGGLRGSQVNFQFFYIKQSKMSS